MTLTHGLPDAQLLPRVSQAARGSGRQDGGAAAVTKNAMAQGQKKGAKPPKALPARARLPNRQAVRDNYNDASSSVRTRAFAREFVFFLKSGFGLSTLIADASSVFLR